MKNKTDKKPHDRVETREESCVSSFEGWCIFILIQYCSRLVFFLNSRLCPHVHLFTEREEGWAKGSRLGWWNPQKQLAWTRGSSWTPDWWLGGQHWTDPNPLHVDVSKETLENYRASGSRSVFIPGEWTLGAHSMWRDAFSAWTHGGGSRPCPRRYDRLWGSPLEGLAVPGEQRRNRVEGWWGGGGKKSWNWLVKQACF